MSNLDVQHMLVLATNHITRETARELEKGDASDEIGGLLTWQYGWVIWVDVGAYDEKFPDLDACMQLARDNGCQWVRFDCDVDPLSSLPVFEWPEDDNETDECSCTHDAVAHNEHGALVCASCGIKFDDEPAPCVCVELRAPKKGERGWWVSAWSDADAALAECRREGAIDDEGPPGWEAYEDYAFVDDREGMRPITLVVRP